MTGNSNTEGANQKYAADQEENYEFDEDQQNVAGDKQAANDDF